MKKKVSFWGLFFEALRNTKAQYRQLKFEAEEKEKLLSSGTNWHLMEKFIQECNKNPDLKVTIKFKDGGSAILTAYRPERTTIDKMLNDITIESDY